MIEDPNKITYFASTNSRGQEIPFGIKRRDRGRHMYIIGKTGMGKSTLLENMAIQDIRNGEGMAFIDPHGSTVERLLDYVPINRIKDVVYFAPFDMEHPMAFNVMEDVGYDKRHLVVSGLLAAFRKIWVDAWSARMEYILSNTLLALLEFEGATLLDVNRMLINKNFRKRVVDNISDPIVKSFWVDEFANYSDRYTQEATPAIQNKIGQFTSNPLIRNIVGQSKSSFDIRQIMDEKKILIMNLSKGKVGEVNANLLGSMLTTKIYLAAMSRADVSANVLSGLPSFYFYVDEFQNFANQSFADILSEARKYKLNLIIAHQYIEQMEEEVRDAVFGNVGTTVAFRVGPFDAEVLETIFQPVFMATDLVNLGFAQIYLTLMINGVGSPPFSATTLKPFDAAPERFTEQVIASSRQQFAKPRESVEMHIKEWNDSDPIVAEAPKPKRAYASASTNRPAAPRAVEAPRAPAPAPAPATSPTYAQEAKTLGADVAYKHAMAASRAEASPTPRPAASSSPATRQARPVGKPTPERPPLEGATSLRDALLKATGKTAPAQSAAPQPRPAAKQSSAHGPVPTLKEALRMVSAASAPPKAAPEQKATGESGLPESVMRTMLAVDEIDGE